jgi:hypothetical protein
VVALRGRALRLAQRWVERDRGQHADRHGHDRAARRVALAAHGRRLHPRVALGDAGHRRGEHDLTPPADPVARLEHANRAAARLQLTGGDEAREAGADDEDVDHAGGSYSLAVR